jgi:hypothetical protein
MNFLFIFLDGVGLGIDDPDVNPLAKAEMPNLKNLLDGRKLVASSTPLINSHATLLAIDPNLGVDGMPQSATGQAALVTGVNVPELIGGHYGPKPNPPIKELVCSGTVFSKLSDAGYNLALLNAYPDTYFQAIESGRRLYAAIPLSVTCAGIKLKTTADLFAGNALSVDFTGQGWREHLGISDTPLLTPQQAGKRLVNLANGYDFAFFEYWPSDFAGHRQDESAALKMLETFDQVLGSIVKYWDSQAGLVFITSDHGNLEDLRTRRHTTNPVPALLIGAERYRDKFTSGLHDLTHVAPAILRMYPGL